MEFYFIVHTILGILVGTTSWVNTAQRARPMDFPNWAINSPWMFMSGVVSTVSALLSIITTAVQYDLLWALATIAEIVLGIIVSAMVPSAAKIMVTAITIPLCVIIMGALWGFWYL